MERILGNHKLISAKISGKLELIQYRCSKDDSILKGDGNGGGYGAEERWSVCKCWEVF